MELDPVDRRLQPLCRVRYERAVEGAGDPKLDRSPGPFVLRLVAALVDSGVLAGDHDLAWAVVVRRPHTDDLAAEPLDDRIIQAEDRRHRTRTLARGLGHCEPSLTDESDRLFGRERIRRGKCRELADGMADDVIRLDASRFQRGQHREAGCDECRLLDGRIDELVLPALEAEMLEIEARGLAAGVEDLHRLRECLGDLAAHPCLERALPWKTERNGTFHHEILPFAVHSIKPEPHVRPAPIPVISTSAPSRKRPSA